MTDLIELLRGNPYPGRGIVVGRDTVYYFIMGRSENSRNRIFTQTEDGIRTEVFDPGKMRDPSLIIYRPVRRLHDVLIVGNGDQTDTIVQTGEFEAALLTRTFEPDAPNYTPRITAMLRSDGSFTLSILKREQGRCLRAFYRYEGCDEQTGYFLSTYLSDGDPLPSFAGEPVAVTLSDPSEVWAALNPENKVSLYANVGGTVTLYNKNLGD